MDIPFGVPDPVGSNGVEECRRGRFSLESRGIQRPYGMDSFEPTHVYNDPEDIGLPHEQRYHADDYCHDITQNTRPL